MAGPIATLRVMLSGDDAQLRKSLGSSDKATKKWAKAQQRRSKAVAQSFKAVGAAAGVASAAIVATTKAAVAYADKLAKTSAKLGVTVEELQKYRFAAERAGINTRTLDMSMQRFTRRLGEAQNGTGVLHKELVRLGIAVRNADGSVRSSEDVLYEYADAIANADNASERLRLAFVAFDSEGAAMVNMFRNGSGALKDLGKELEAAGLIMSGETTKKAEQLSDQFGTMGDILRNKTYTAAIEMAHTALPAMIAAMNGAEAVFHGVIAAGNFMVGSFYKIVQGVYSLAANFTKAVRWMTDEPALAMQMLPIKLNNMFSHLQLAFIDGIAAFAAMGDAALSKAPEWLKDIMGYESGGLVSANRGMAQRLRENISATQAVLTEMTSGSTSTPSALESILFGSAEAAGALSQKFINDAVSTANQARSAISGGGIASTGAAFGASGGSSAAGEEAPQVQQAKTIADKLISIEQDTQNRLRSIRETSAMQALDILKGYVNANSKAGAAILAVQEGIAIANVVMSGAEASSAAWKSGDPFKAALIIASSAAQVATSISTIKSASGGVQGQFHDGIDHVPNTGTYLLEKGERVVDKRLNADLKTALNGGGGVGGGSNFSITVNGVSDADTINRVITEQRPQFERMLRDINSDRAGQGLI